MCNGKLGFVYKGTDGSIAMSPGRTLLRNEHPLKHDIIRSTKLKVVKVGHVCGRFPAASPAPVARMLVAFGAGLACGFGLGVLLTHVIERRRPRHN